MGERKRERNREKKGHEYEWLINVPRKKIELSESGSGRRAQD